MHQAAMECFRRAVVPNQRLDTPSKPRRDGANLSRGMAEMLENLSCWRGKSSQIVRVERVMVAEDGRAIVGAIAASAGQGGDNNDEGDTEPREPPPRRTDEDRGDVYALANGGPDQVPSARWM